MTTSIFSAHFSPKLLTLAFRWAAFIALILSSYSIAFSDDRSGSQAEPTSAAAAVAAAPFDFDGDRKADLAVFRQSEGDWYIANSGAANVTILHFGLNGDTPVAADYDGDGKYDVAVYRNGAWYRLFSSNFTWDVVNFGLSADTPTPGDFDGDGKADVAVYRPSEGVWYRRASSNSAFSAIRFGLADDVPAAGDYDGDGKADINLFRPSTGTWYRMNSSDNRISSFRFGISEDRAVVGDFDGDGKADTAVWRPSNGMWYIQKSSVGAVMMIAFGISTDVPVAADYDGDGKTDIAVFRPSDGSWHWLNSSNSAYHSTSFGISTDTPIGAKPKNPRPNPGPTPTPTPTPTRTPTPTPNPTPTPVSTPNPTPTPVSTPNPTPTPVSTPNPTPTPIPTPTPQTSFTCDYYASPTGSSSGAGTSSSPWDLQSALIKSNLIVAGKTLCLRGGTYKGKYRSTLQAGTVRSYPGEWAVIDGYRTTTLAQNITASQTVFTLTNGTGFGFNNVPVQEAIIGSEVLQLYNVTGNQVTESFRARSGSISAAQSYPAGTLVILGGTNLQVEGNSTVYRDFEVMCSNPNRDGNVMPELGRGNGIFNIGNGNKFVNLIVHDTMNGVFSSNASQNTEIYGVLTYNNGAYYGTEGKGHGLYLENSAGYSRVYETISINNFNLGAQYFGVTASYVGGDTQGSIFANSGSPLGKFNPAQRNFNLLVGTDSQRIPSINVQNNYFFQPHTSGGSNLSWGYGAGISNGTVTNNYFVGGGGAMLEVGNTVNSTVTNNKFYGTAPGVYYALVSAGSSYTWNSNTYYKAQNRDVYALQGVGVFGIASWKSQTGYDASSTETSTDMPDMAIVRPNSYTPGRANIIVYLPSRATAVNVNLSTSGLTNGQSFVIKNAFNYGGPAVFTGTYNTANPVITLPMTGNSASVAGPIGAGYTPTTTVPDFGAFVVVPSGSN